MPVSYILRAYDAGGVGYTEIALEDGALGYPHVIAYDADGSTELGEVANLPTSAPPTGELPFYDGDGTTLLGTFAFDLSNVGSGYERLAQIVFAGIYTGLQQGTEFTEGVPYPGSGGTGAQNNADLPPTVTWEGAAPMPADSKVRCYVRMSPTALMLMERSPTQLRLRIKADARVTVRTQLEVGAARAMFVAGWLRNMLGGVDGVRCGSPRARRLGREEFAEGWWAIEYVQEVWRDYLVDRIENSGDPSRAEFDEVVADLQTEFADEVATPLGLVVHYENAPPTSPDSDEVSVVLTMEQSSDLGEGQILASDQPVRRRLGSMTATIMASIGGMARLWRTVDGIVERFTFRSIGAACLTSPTVSTLGADGRFVMVMVVCPFYVDEQQPAPPASIGP